MGGAILLGAIPFARREDPAIGELAVEWNVGMKMKIGAIQCSSSAGESWRGRRAPDGQKKEEGISPLSQNSIASLAKRASAHSAT